MNVAFCVNRLMLPGLYAAIRSLVTNASDRHSLSLYVIHNGLSSAEVAQIQKIAGEELHCHYSLIECDPNRHFGELRALHGDRTNYVRLLLPELIPDSRVLYLDSDLIVDCDTLQLEAFNFQGAPLAAVRSGEFAYSLDHGFLIETLGLPPGSRGFNSGVLLFDLEAWRKADLTKRCLSFAAEYNSAFLDCDQTILNALFTASFAELPEALNIQWQARRPPLTPHGAIFHFVGSPKPWDIFGSVLHTGFKKWHVYSRSADGADIRALLQRAWHIRRSYARVVLERIKSHQQPPVN
jgi:lipopolysaccharide biosynthesis glycosyltransferase